MKTLFLECTMGAAGDMLMAALLELHNDPSGFTGRLNAAGIPGVCVTAEVSIKCGIVGTHIAVTVNGREEHSMDAHIHAADHEHNHNHGHSHTHDHHHEHSHDHKHGVTHSHEGQNHSHSGMQDIEHLIHHLDVSAGVKKNALSVYGLIAEAESHAHGVPVNEIHFHEVGNMDAVADIVGVCMLMEELAPELILASPVHVGGGHVHCAHGILPVPAPATAYILKDVPIYGSNIQSELCTPTGAALLKHFVKRFEAMPVMSVSKIGYGMGKKDFEPANCVRAFTGQTSDNVGEVAELTCNLDDMTPEAIAFTQQLLLDEGALDAYTIPIGMKKGRPATMLACMCRRESTDKIVALIFKHTTTLGIRETVSRRYTLRREQHEAQTQYGSVRIKTAVGYGVTKSKPEYEDIARIARDNGISIIDAAKIILDLEVGNEPD